MVKKKTNPISEIQPFKVGDKVTTSFHIDDVTCIRTVIEVVQSNSQSGWGVRADGGQPCPCCGRQGRMVQNYRGEPIDSKWFNLIERVKE